MGKDNNQLKQKTFSQKPNIMPQNTKNNGLASKNNRIRLNSIAISSKVSTIANKLLGNRTVSVQKIILMVYWLFFVIANYYLFYVIEIKPETITDYTLLLFWSLASAVVGIRWVDKQLKINDGYILKYIIALVYGVIGDIVGLVVVCIGILILDSIFSEIAG